MELRNKISLSVIFLFASIALIYYTFMKWTHIPRVDENIDLSQGEMLFSRRFRYAYEEEFPVTVQRIFLSPQFSNVIEVSDGSGKPLRYARQKEFLIIYFEEPLSKGRPVDYQITAKVPSFSPYINLVRHDSNRFSFHYITWESQPAIKRKNVILPKSSRIRRVYSTVKNILVAANRVQTRGNFNSFKKFDLSVLFSLPEEALSNVMFVNIDGGESFQKNGRVIFTAPKNLYPEAPSLRGDFTGWKDLPMRDGGEEYVFSTNLPDGTYRYQYRYKYIPMCDNSVEERGISAYEESFSIVRVTNG